MRLFLALWPDAAVVRQIEAARQKLFGSHPPGRTISSDKLHITLQFLGHTEESSLDCIRQAAAAIRFPAFDLRLDHLGHWFRPRVVWLGCHQAPEALTTLVRDLNTGMAGCGFAPEERPFHPHLTLLRKVRRQPPQEIEPIVWHVDTFVLVESDTRPEGVQYRILERWPAQESAPQI
jgi:2'-5' RNA ligase